MFRPPCCPHRACSQHLRPRPDFCVRAGTYHPKCRSHPVQRYRCRHCRRTFSRQTFRADYRDHKPDRNARLFMLIASGVGIRQSSRQIGLTLRNTQNKLRKIARHLRRLNLNLRSKLEGPARFHFDELETYEGQRNARPLTVPVLIESSSRYIVWAESGTIRPRGKMTPKRVKAILESQRRHGIRRDRSRRAIRRTLNRGADLLEDSTRLVLETDEKSSYPDLARRAFRTARLSHVKTNSKLPRTSWNPLFPINHEEAVMRDLMGRMRRESWLVSKTRRYLDLGLHVHMAFRNLVRRRFNYDEDSPAQLLGFAPRRLSPTEVLSWRQDWGQRSVHPLSRRGTVLRRWRRARAT